MARNPVQFQKGISLSEFLSLYGTEQQCFDALYQWRGCNSDIDPLRGACSRKRNDVTRNPDVAAIGLGE